MSFLCFLVLLGNLKPFCWQYIFRLRIFLTHRCPWAGMLMAGQCFATICPSRLKQEKDAEATHCKVEGWTICSLLWWCHVEQWQQSMEWESAGFGFYAGTAISSRIVSKHKGLDSDKAIIPHEHFSLLPARVVKQVPLQFIQWCAIQYSEIRKFRCDMIHKPVFIHLCTVLKFPPATAHVASCPELLRPGKTMDMDVCWCDLYDLRSQCQWLSCAQATVKASKVWTLNNPYYPITADFALHVFSFVIWCDLPSHSSKEPFCLESWRAAKDPANLFDAFHSALHPELSRKARKRQRSIALR